MSTNSSQGETTPVYSFTPPQYLYTTEAVKQGEAAAIAQQQGNLETLLLRAGQALFQLLQHDGPKRSLWLLIGPGNNGADGWVVARLAAQAGWPIRVFATTPNTELAQQARAAFLQAFPQHRVQLLAQLPAALEQESAPATIVDALFGAGLNRPLNAEFAAAVAAVNCWRDRLTTWVAAPVVAVDVPTGLAGDSGEVLGEDAMVADLTLTMVAAKVGLYTGSAAHYVGRRALAELGIGAEFAEFATPLATLTNYLSATAGAPRRHPLGKRRADSHKGQHGQLLVIGGAVGMAGAVALAGLAALRSGVGKVTLVTAAANVQALHSQQAEWLVTPLAETDPLPANLATGSADSIVLGPGLGRSAWSQQIVTQVVTDIEKQVAQPAALVLDADALFGLAQTPQLLQQLPAGTVLTPHPKEAARLLQTTKVEPNRLHTAQALVQLAPQVIWVLKGAGTLVVSGHAQTESAPAIHINYSGCAALASAGSGDVLAGLIGSLLAQRQPTTHTERLELVKFAVWAHGYAAQLAAVDGERGTIASDLMSPLRWLMNPEGLRR